MAGRLGILRSALLLVLVLPGLAGCGSQSGPAGPQLTGPLPSTSTSPPPSGHQFGESASSTTGFVGATVFGYSEQVAPSAAPPSAGHMWAAADVQACALPGSVFQVTVSDAPWSLRFADGTVVNVSQADDPQFPQPRYPSTPTALQSGECLRGWLIFQVPTGNPPTVVRYTPQGGPSIDWLVP
jgi:hypothetical protein